MAPGRTPGGEAGKAQGKVSEYGPEAKSQGNVDGERVPQSATESTAGDIPIVLQAEPSTASSSITPEPSVPPEAVLGVNKKAGADERVAGVVETAISPPADDNFRARRFAQKDEFSWWFPKITDDEKEIKSSRIWTSRRSRTLMLQISVVAAILVANLALTILAVGRFPSNQGVGLIYEGDCTTVGKLDEWLHLLINLLSTGMLSASNYCMQLQAAPTRADVDRAHRSNRWVDIGVPSLRNLKFIGNWRRFSWTLLAFSSVPIHLIYNSAVFQSLSSYDYTITVVKDSFLHNATWSLETALKNQAGDPGWDDSRVDPPTLNYTQVIQGIQRDAVAVPYVNKNITECFALYDDYFAPQGNAVILVRNESVQTPADDSLLMFVSVIPRSDDWGKNLWALGNGTGRFVAVSPDEPVTSWFLGPPHYEVSRCLVQPLDATATTCRFEYSPWIMLIVCGLNLTKALVMLCIWLLRRWQDRERKDAQKEVLYTLGDAVASFMRDPDPTTADMCLATREDFISKRTWKNRLVLQHPQPSQEPREWKYESRRWMAAASVRRWFILLAMCLIVIVVVAILLGTSFPSLHLRRISTSMASLWSMGFGQLQPYTYIVIGLPRADPAGLISNVLIANLPQLILSILYIFYNAMMSTFLVQREFSLLYARRKPLRVSEPLGIQRSSYFISLPLRYGVPLYLTSGLMHWLISQSLFLARITAIHPDGTDDVPNSFSTCGYSPIAIVITLLVGLVLVLGIVIMGFRSYDGTMRMVSTNSRAISAACHALEEDRPSGYLLPVKWGVVESKNGIGHCAFTTAPSHETQLPEAGRLYR